MNTENIENVQKRPKVTISESEYYDFVQHQLNQAQKKPKRSPVTYFVTFIISVEELEQ